ncbi:spermatogenesis-associated serine-rich protein 2-like isoform X2 [Dreissena polymorpha]|uniref:spermatogenesis-associated serine-rich protein 2-like isoform X2 n=1 Tax=Dreissena polymorpha TaxID=45954 RepID=UPI0022651BF3|nr:spermatogenesis-associated serine-rich protein 2-like isoform X2 [Dreissena polymorpha]
MMAKKNDTRDTVMFNSRTKAVTANVASEENIKDKVSAVREVVSGQSNNQIVLVLQYYEYSVEKTIQAFIEDGAKQALTEWQHSGTKPVKKKKNKKKGGQARPGTGEGSDLRTNGPSLLNGASLLNGDADSVIVNGDLHNGMHTPTVIPQGPKAHTYQASLPTADSGGKASPTPQTFKPRPDQKGDFIPNGSIPGSNTAELLSKVKQGVVNKTEVNLPGQIEVSSAAEKSEALPQRQPKQRTHSGSHSHGRPPGHHNNHDNHLHDNRERTESTSSIDGSHGGKKHTYMNLEKSGKDLHRQVVSLERLRLVFEEEVDRSVKKVKAVIDEIRHCLDAKESSLVVELNAVRAAGHATFITRQGQATQLKTMIDRAERLTEPQLTELRADIKHFVSERKLDEDIARVTRFVYDDDSMKKRIQQFAEVVPVKSSYQWHGSSVVDAVLTSTGTVESSIQATGSSSTHTVPPSGPSKPSAAPTDTIKPSVPHVDPAEAHEIAELQRRLKHSLTLEGIPVQTYPERISSAPAAPTVAAETDTPKNVATSSARGGPRGNRERRRNDRPRGDQPVAEKPQEDGRSGFTQTSSGDRVIFIGRKTGPQGGGRGSNRGGPGRGRGGYRGDRNRGGNDTTNPPSGNVIDNSNSTSDSTTVLNNAGSKPEDKPRSPGGNRGNRRGGSASGRGSSPQKSSAQRGDAESPRKGAQGSSGSPRRGRGRGGPVNRSPGALGNQPPGNNSNKSESRGAESTENKEG